MDDVKGQVESATNTMMSSVVAILQLAVIPSHNDATNDVALMRVPQSEHASRDVAAALIAEHTQRFMQAARQLYGVNLSLREAVCRRSDGT